LFYSDFLDHFFPERIELASIPVHGALFFVVPLGGISGHA